MKYLLGLLAVIVSLLLGWRGIVTAIGHKDSIGELPAFLISAVFELLVIGTAFWYYGMVSAGISAHYRRKKAEKILEDCRHIPPGGTLSFNLVGFELKKDLEERLNGSLTIKSYDYERKMLYIERKS